MFWLVFRDLEYALGFRGPEFLLIGIARGVLMVVLAPVWITYFALDYWGAPP